MAVRLITSFDGSAAYAIIRRESTQLITSFDGSAAFAIIRRESDGYAWNSAAFEAWANGNIGSYDIPLSSLGGNLWGADLPAALAGIDGLRAYFYEQAGASPATTDLRFGSMAIAGEATTSDGYVWNGSAFEAWVNGNIATYDIPLSDIGGNLWGADLPAALVGIEGLRAYFYEQAGGSPATTDLRFGSMEIEAAEATALDDGAIYWPTSRGLNLYAGLAETKARLKITNTNSDSLLFMLIHEASRLIDDACGRYFYSETATKHPYIKESNNLLLKNIDLLSIATLKTDEDGDRVYEITWGLTDYDLVPDDDFPKWRIVLAPNGTYSLPAGRRTIELTGIWGYGDGKRAAPWDALGITATLASSSTASGTVSAAGLVQAGHTILLGTEQVFVGSVNGTAIGNLVRGANGTVAAAQSAVAAFGAAYPETIRMAARWLTETAYGRAGSQGKAREEIERVSIEWMRSKETREDLESIVSPYRRLSI